MTRMLTLIAIVGILIVFACAYGAATPSGLLDMSRRVANRGGFRFAMAVRLVLGVVSILAAPDSRLPVFLYAVGAVSLAGEVVLAVIGLPGYLRIMDRVSRIPAGMLRAFLVFGLVFGAALIWVTGIV